MSCFTNARALDYLVMLATSWIEDDVWMIQYLKEQLGGALVVCLCAASSFLSCTTTKAGYRDSKKPILYVTRPNQNHLATVIETVTITSGAGTYNGGPYYGQKNEKKIISDGLMTATA